MADPSTATSTGSDSVPALTGHGSEIVRHGGRQGRLTGMRQLDEMPGLGGKADGIAGQVMFAAR